MGCGASTQRPHTVQPHGQRVSVGHRGKKFANCDEAQWREKGFWIRLETKGLDTFDDLYRQDVGFTLIDIAGFPKHCVVRGDADEWQVRCIDTQSVLPTAVSYRWGLEGSITEPMHVECSDCHLVMQGANGGLSPLSLPPGTWWVDHLCTTTENVFHEMSRAAVLYYARRLVKEGADAERGWLIWERGLAEEPLHKGDYTGDPDDGIVGYTGRRLAAILQKAAESPMYDNTDLFWICQELQLVGSIVLSRWEAEYNSTGVRIPEMCKEEGKRMIPVDDPWFGNEGLFANRIEWKTHWVSTRGVGMSINPDVVSPNSSHVTLGMWWYTDRKAPFYIEASRVSPGIYRVQDIVTEANMRCIVPASFVKYLG
eukprot:GFYU01022607.1.p1 GENE.GFYU01022607.1~~GFYU01022607.1.p1  ORF type:complete len:369 (-),score=70.50 GFYU01022607.1:140-1246(-)